MICSSFVVRIVIALKPLNKNISEICTMFSCPLLCLLHLHAPGLCQPLFKDH